MPAKQRGFNEIMTEHTATKQSPAAQLWNTTVLHEGADPQDRVVTPEDRVAQLQRSQPGKKQRTKQLRPKLLHPCIKGTGIDQLWRGLEDSDVRRALHQLYQLHQGLTAHDTVGIEHDHVVKILTPAAKKIEHVAGLALYVDGAAPVVNAAMGTERFTKSVPCPLLFQPEIWVAAVRENEKLEGIQCASTGQAQVGGPKTRKTALHFFVVDGEQNGGGFKRLLRSLLRRMPLERTAGIASEPAQHKPVQREPKSNGDPAKQHAEQDQDDHFQWPRAMVGQYADQKCHSGPSGRQHQRQKHKAPQRRHPAPARVRGTLSGRCCGARPVLGHRLSHVFGS